MLAGTLPTATDGYRANLNSVNVDAEFCYKFGVYDWRYPNPYFASSIKDGDPISKPKFLVNGSWGCDGKVERFFVPVENAVANKSYKTLDPFEALFDGETFASIEGLSRSSVISVRRTNSLPINVIGPFEWWSSSLTQIIDTEYPGISPKAEDRTWMGVPCKYNSYMTGLAPNWQKLEVYFDPGWNFVPRFARIMSFDRNFDTLYVKDVLVVDVVQCKAGGFFPREWYDRSFSVSKMSRKRPEFSADSDTMNLVGDSRIVFGQFKIDSFRDTSAPVALHPGPKIKVLGALGGFVPSQVAKPTLQDLTRQLGRKIDSNPIVPKLNIDDAEQRANQPRASVFPYQSMLIGLVSLSCLGLLFRRIRARRLLPLCILAALASSGCGAKEPVTPKVAINFSKPLVLCEPDTQSLEDEVIVKNQADLKLRVFGVDGGCSCRSLDKSAFPFDLGPHESKKVPITFTRKNDYQDQAIAFQVSTSAGIIGAMTAIRVVPRLKITPENLSSVLKELKTDQVQEDTFTIQVRTINKVGETPIAYTMSGSPGLTLSQPPKSVDKGTTAFASDLQYTETTYQVSIDEKSLGLKKGQVEAVGRDGRTLSQSTIVWQRRAFLSATPPQVLLADYQIRVFLHSENDKTSFTKIKATPPGVTAALVSPHELTVARDKDHPSKQNGQIQIETDDREHPLLSIDLVHADGI